MSTLHVSDEDRHEIWDCHLDDYSAIDTARYKVDLPVSVVRKVLKEPMPSSFVGDERLLPYFWNWWSFEGHLKDKSGEECGFILVRYARKTPKAFQAKGFNSINRMYRERNMAIKLGHANEHLEVAAAEKFIAKGYPAWAIAIDGTISELTLP